MYCMNRILIVEDEEFLARALKDNLETEGYDIAVAANAEEARDSIRKSPPDLILLDLLMPKTSGFSVLEELKKSEEWKLIPVIVLSNLGGDADIKKAMELGADDYFVKSQHPIEEVIDEIKKYLGGAKATPQPQKQ